jgi:hypothetical protein
VGSLDRHKEIKEALDSQFQFSYPLRVFLTVLKKRFRLINCATGLAG